jgi:hypothetical protein
MPALPLDVPREHLGPTGSYRWFGTGTSDGEGTYVSLLSGYKWAHYDFYVADGNGEMVSSIMTGIGMLSEQPHGFQSLDIDTSGPDVEHLSVWDGAGRLLLTVPFSAGNGYTLVPDPSGGSVVGTHTHWASPYSTATWLERFDGDARSTGSSFIGDNGEPVAIATSGEALVVKWNADGPGRVGRWYDCAAQAITDWFPIGLSSGLVDPLFTPLANGSVAAAEGTPARNAWLWTWKALLRPPTTTVEPPPEWLVAENGYHGAIVRGGRAMAFVPDRTGETGCTTAQCGTIDILTRDGVYCGTVSLPGGSDVTLNIGKDGTVFAVQVPTGAPVRWRWWPKLLQ